MRLCSAGQAFRLWKWLQSVTIAARMRARLAGFFMTEAQEVVSLATVNYHRVAQFRGTDGTREKA